MNANRSGYIPARGSVRRLKALAFLGHDETTLAGWCRTDTAAIHRLLFKFVKSIPADLHNRIVKVYEEYCMTPGHCETMRATARDMVWASALAWEDIDIDDSAARPDRRAKGWVDPTPNEPMDQDVQFVLEGVLNFGSKVDPRSHAIRARAIRILLDKGWQPDRIAKRLGCTDRTVHRVRNLPPEIATPPRPETGKVAA